MLHPIACHGAFSCQFWRLSPDVHAPSWIQTSGKSGQVNFAGSSKTAVTAGHRNACDIHLQFLLCGQTPWQPWKHPHYSSVFNSLFPTVRCWFGQRLFLMFSICAFVTAKRQAIHVSCKMQPMESKPPTWRTRTGKIGNSSCNYIN